MITVREVKTHRYDPKEFGLLRAKRRRTRIKFATGSWRRHQLRPYGTVKQEKTLRALLPKIFERIKRTPYAPLPFPPKIKAEWVEGEQAFVLRCGSGGAALSGFEVTVLVEVEDDDAQSDAQELPEASTVALHGSPLPNLGR